MHFVSLLSGQIPRWCTRTFLRISYHSTTTRRATSSSIFERLRLMPDFTVLFLATTAHKPIRFVYCNASVNHLLNEKISSLCIRAGLWFMQLSEKGSQRSR